MHLWALLGNMNVKTTLEARHIHKWELYVPAIDMDLASYLGVSFEQSQWAYRRCDCRTKMRCKATALYGYAKSCAAYADEEWEPID